MAESSIAGESERLAVQNSRRTANYAANRISKILVLAAFFFFLKFVCEVVFRSGLRGCGGIPLPLPIFPAKNLKTGELYGSYTGSIVRISSCSYFQDSKFRRRSHHLATNSIVLRMSGIQRISKNIRLTRCEMGWILNNFRVKSSDLGRIRGDLGMVKKLFDGRFCGIWASGVTE